MATIRERRLFESGVYFVQHGYSLKQFSEKVNTSTRIVYYCSFALQKVASKVHFQILSGVRVIIDGSEVVWRSQPRARSSISRYALEAGSTKLARKMDTYIMAKFADDA